MIVVGAGPAGLATAGALIARGRRVIVLERADHLVSAWTGLRPSLRLHTTRHRSALPGMRIDRRLGQYLRTGDFVDACTAYAERLGIDVRTGSAVTRVALLAGGAGRARWSVRTAHGDVLRAHSVVLATGRLGAPRIPAWPGLADYRRTVLHVAELHDPAAFAGRSVLVVGSGNAGAEACVDLASAGAAPVLLAVRTPPHLLHRRIGPFPAQTVAAMLERLPIAVADRLAALQRRLTVPDLRRRGLPAPVDGLYSGVARRHIPPTNDTGIVDAIRAGRVTPVAAPAAFRADSVLLVDGTTVTPDAVIAATGYGDGSAGLPPLVGIDPVESFTGPSAGHPEHGLYVVGFDVRASGILHEIARRARWIAKNESGPPQPRAGTRPGRPSASSAPDDGANCARRPNLPEPSRRAAHLALLERPHAARLLRRRPLR